jgi:hypothetical protein
MSFADGWCKMKVLNLAPPTIRKVRGSVFFKGIWA